MAWVPCMKCGERFTGEANNVYLQWFVQQDIESYRFVVCTPCLSDIMQPWRAGALWRNPNGEWEQLDGEVQPDTRLVASGGPRRGRNR
jgi:DNA-directed RNA polymerase subunit RPC12/RpoP